MYISTHTMSTCKSECTHIYVYIYRYRYAPYMCVHIFMYIYIYTYVHVYTHMQAANSGMLLLMWQCTLRGYKELSLMDE